MKAVGEAPRVGNPGEALGMPAATVFEYRTDGTWARPYLGWDCFGRHRPGVRGWQTHWAGSGQSPY